MSVGDPERLARVALSRLAEPGDPRLLGLAAELGAVQLHALLVGGGRVYPGASSPGSSAGRADGGGSDDVRQQVATDVAARLAGIHPGRELEQAALLGIRFVVPGDDEWPTQLGDLAHAPPLQERGLPPLGLWVKGPLRLDSLVASVAVVGSRSATSYGAQLAAEIAASVSRAGLTVVSGAAFGIDQCAHRGALAAGRPTVAVLACGADRVYPTAHRLLIEHLADEHAVISEAPPGAAPTRVRFLARNRLIAALTRGTVIVEAAERSGALNTANWAARLNRPVMGVPGPVTSAPSAGVHTLIRSGAATLVTSGDDVLELVAEAGGHLTEVRRGSATSRDPLSTRQRQVLDAVPLTRGAEADSISRVAGVGVLEVRSALTKLLDVGLVERGDGGWRLTALASH